MQNIDNMEKYTGQPLEEDQYLLKLKGGKAFLTKLNKNGTIPLKFQQWCNSEIYIFTEYYRSGWKWHFFRGGESQDWAVMMHPEGFTLEIYLDNLMEIIPKIDVIKGELIGKFKWEKNKLIE